MYCVSVHACTIYNDACPVSVSHMCTIYYAHEACYTIQLTLACNRMSYRMQPEMMQKLIAAIVLAAAFICTQGKPLTTSDYIPLEKFNPTTRTTTKRDGVLPQGCSVTLKNITVRHPRRENCTAVIPGVPSCEGKCISYQWYIHNATAVNRVCYCCQATAYSKSGTERTIEFNCSDVKRKTFVFYVPHVISCGCAGCNML